MQRPSLDGRSILIVEDEPLIVMDARLTERGIPYLTRLKARAWALRMSANQPLVGGSWLQWKASS